MPTKQAKGAPVGIPRSVRPLEESDDGTDEDVTINGAPVLVPHSCGADGNEHRFGSAHFSWGGNVVLFPQ